ncbi:uncharacterized protein BO95DRAFT_33065 [Aspergillus brunneoviolaceus CBS 621.78]|uniref:Uncharacterized protein n=1 Tax=Aspergillus brunneoviolaceus CBS 621.78 TaxID=1450534 RepID=A0ACD1FSN4_9EURO|nr:hypothetical protein BO95DRAFT_33065 [Aspergillus brunneoviolaceus CBS 621.78]RAH40001.1 hypothetical protein BO95DRAFT_33065 [Aspergillus brunneoviolaceus CBS 621.78]
MWTYAALASLLPSSPNILPQCMAMMEMAQMSPEAHLPIPYGLVTAESALQCQIRPRHLTPPRNQSDGVGCGSGGSQTTYRPAPALFIARFLVLVSFSAAKMDLLFALFLIGDFFSLSFFVFHFIIIRLSPNHHYHS